MANVLRAVSFVVFVVLGLWVAAAPEPDARRRRCLALLTYVLTLNAAVILTQRDDWPFSSYPLVERPHEADRVYSRVDLRAFDAQGREWLIDPLAWSPIPLKVLWGWFNWTFPTLSDPEKQRLGAFLLERAETTRQRRVAGKAVGYALRLGRLAAPHDLSYRLFDSTGFATEAGPLVGLRIYRLSWIPRERFQDPSKLLSEVVFEYRP